MANNYDKDNNILSKNNQAHSVYRKKRLRIFTQARRPKCKVHDIRYQYLGKAFISRSNCKDITICYTNFRGAQFSRTSFCKAKIISSEFRGTLFNYCDFRNAVFKNCIFIACKFRHCQFFQASFTNVIMANNQFMDTDIEVLSLEKGIEKLNIQEKNFISKELSEVIFQLKENDFIRKTHVLHMPHNRINIFNIFFLLKLFSESELLLLLPRLQKLKKEVINFYFLVDCLKKEKTML